MAKRRIYKKPKNGGPIEVTARQLNELYRIHDGILPSRLYPTGFERPRRKRGDFAYVFRTALGSR